MTLHLVESLKEQEKDVDELKIKISKKLNLISIERKDAIRLSKVIKELLFKLKKTNHGPLFEKEQFQFLQMYKEYARMNNEKAPIVNAIHLKMLHEQLNQQLGISAMTYLESVNEAIKLKKEIIEVPEKKTFKTLIDFELMLDKVKKYKNRINFFNLKLTKITGRSASWDSKNAIILRKALLANSELAKYPSLEQLKTTLQMNNDIIGEKRKLDAKVHQVMDKNEHEILTDWIPKTLFSDSEEPTQLPLFNPDLDDPILEDKYWTRFDMSKNDLAIDIDQIGHFMIPDGDVELIEIATQKILHKI